MCFLLRIVLIYSTFLNFVPVQSMDKKDEVVLPSQVLLDEVKTGEQIYAAITSGLVSLQTFNDAICAGDVQAVCFLVQQDVTILLRTDSQGATGYQIACNYYTGCKKHAAELYKRLVCSKQQVRHWLQAREIGEDSSNRWGGNILVDRKLR